MSFNNKTTHIDSLKIALITIGVYEAGVIYFLRTGGGEAHYFNIPIFLIQAPLTIALLFKQKWAAVALAVYFCILTALFGIGLLNSLVYRYSLDSILMGIGITMISLVPALLLIRSLRNDEAPTKKDR